MQNTLPSSLAGNGDAKLNLEDNAKSFISDLIDRIHWTPVRAPLDPTLLALVQAEVDSWQVDLSPKLKERLITGSCFLTSSCYPYATFDHLSYTALWTAYFVYAEDHCAKNVERVSLFSRRLLSGQKQDDPVLERFARHLEKMYDFFPVISCNFILSATCDFLSAVVMEYTLSAGVGKDMSAPGFPLYLRLKTAAAIPFAYFLFPKTESEDVSDFVQAIP